MAIETGKVVTSTTGTTSLTTQATGTLQAAQAPAFTGDVTSTAGSLALTVAANAVSNTKLADMAANSIKGNNTGGAADPADLTTAQVKTMLAIAQADVTNLVSDLALKAPLASPPLTGTPTSAGQFQFADGSLGAPGVAFTSSPTTGMRRPAADILAFDTAGVEAFRLTAGQNILFGSSTFITGIATSRITTQGASAATAQWALGQFTNNANGPTFAFGKSRAATVATYTILTAGDTLGNIEAFGADGTTMILAARIQGYNIGTPALGDVRGGWRIQTGSGAGAVTTRLTIDATTVAATLPITSTGAITAATVLTGGFTAHGAGTLALAFATANNCSVTPNVTGSFTTTVPPAGTICKLIITTSGTTSYTMTFGTGFISTGTLATGTVTAKTFTVSFISNGTSVIETSRTVAM